MSVTGAHLCKHFRNSINNGKILIILIVQIFGGRSCEIFIFLLNKLLFYHSLIKYREFSAIK